MNKIGLVGLNVGWFNWRGQVEVRAWECPHVPCPLHQCQGLGDTVTALTVSELHCAPRYRAGDHSQLVVLLWLWPTQLVVKYYPSSIQSNIFCCFQVNSAGVIEPGEEALSWQTQKCDNKCTYGASWHLKVQKKLPIKSIWHELLWDTFFHWKLKFSWLLESSLKAKVWLNYKKCNECLFISCDMRNYQWQGGKKLTPTHVRL